MATPVTTSARAPATLVEELAPDIAALKGDVYSQMGVRAYRVFRCVRSWDGGEAGRGRSTTTRTEIGCGTSDSVVGPARVVLAGAFSRAQQGIVEDGFAMVEDIDPTLLEADLSGFGRLAGGDEEFYEIVEDGRGGAAPDLPVQRYTLAARPFRGPSALSWCMRLKAQEPGAPFGNAQLAADGGTP